MLEISVTAEKSADAVKEKNKYPYEEETRSRYGQADEFRKDSKRKKASSTAKRPDVKKSKKRRRGKRKYVVSKWVGMLLAALQFVLSVIFVVNVMFFDMLSSTYNLILILALFILLGVTLLSQISAKKRGIPGKIFCIILCIALIAGSFYLGKVNSAFKKITGNSQKTSSVVVAVLKENPAEKLQDIERKEFGIQYATNADQMNSAVKTIENELDREIKLKEYQGIIEEAEGLIEGDVEAIIFNPSHATIVKEQIPDFEKKIKIIYSHELVIEIENTAVDQNVMKPFAVYLSGIDVEGDISIESRSDVNIIAVVNPESHQVLLVTTPRDYYVPIPGISGGQRDKLTHAGLYGVDASMDTLSKLYDVEIPFYGRVNFTSMINIVDALGGLEVDSDQEFNTGREAGKVFHVKKGINHLDGKQALAFCRERKNLPGGDNDRGRHQQAVLTAIIKKMMSPAMLRGATDIINSVSDGVDTNFSMEQIQMLIKEQLTHGGAWNIYSVAAEGEPAPERKICYSSGRTPLYVTLPDDTSVANIQNLIQKTLDGETIEGSTVAE